MENITIRTIELKLGIPDSSKYGSNELLLPKNQVLRYDGKFFEGHTGFDASIARAYISDSDGVSIRRQDKELRSKEEDSLDLSNIYPSRVGEVTAVEVTKDGFCDFFDTTIPEGLDFSKPESRFKGEAMTVIFQSGMLAGKEFEIQQTEAKVAGYIHSERRFKVVEQMIDGFAMPKNSYMPKVGDKYAVFGISLPDAYVCDNAAKSGASWDMLREAAKYLYENEEQKFTFTGELDGIWAKRDWLNIGGRIKLGGYVLFSDPQFQPDGVGIRIVGIKDFINNPHSPEIELSNSVVGSSIMSDLRKIESNEVLEESHRKESLLFTKRRFSDSKATIELLEQSLLDFSESIDPIAVRTMLISLGDESLQYEFKPAILHEQFEWIKETKTLFAPTGVVKHMTLGINSISSSHGDDEYRNWDLFQMEFLLDEPKEKYFLYIKAKAELGSNEADYFISPIAIGLSDVPGYYHLLVGTITVEHEDGSRAFTSLYGFTEITPGQLRTPMIVSPDGKTYFDVENGEIGGKFVFVNKKGDKETLIDGGFINTASINTDNLCVENLRTKNKDDSNDKRHIEITSASNAMTMHDAEGVARLVVHGASYKDVNEIIGVAEVPPASFNATSFEMGWKYGDPLGFKMESKEVVVSSFSIVSDSNYTMVIPPLKFVFLGATTGSLKEFDQTIYCYMELYKDGYSMGYLHYDRVYMYLGKTPSETVVTPPLMSYELGKGSYAIKISFDGDYFMTGYPAQPTVPGPSFKLSAAVSLVNANDKVQISGLSQVTKLFANGFASTWSSNKYFSVINRDEVGSDLIDAQGCMRFMSESGVHGLRFTDSGIALTDSGANATPTWHEMTPGTMIGGSIKADGSIRHDVRWGKSFTVIKLSRGKYKIKHDLVSDNYYVSALPINNNSWAKVHAGIAEKTKDYVVIGIYDSGTDGTAVDFDFDFTICGGS